MVNLQENLSKLFSLTVLPRLRSLEVAPNGHHKPEPMKLGGETKVPIEAGEDTKSIEVVPQVEKVPEAEVQACTAIIQELEQGYLGMKSTFLAALADDSVSLDHLKAGLAWEELPSDAQFNDEAFTQLMTRIHTARAQQPDKSWYIRDINRLLSNEFKYLAERLGEFTPKNAQIEISYHVMLVKDRQTGLKRVFLSETQLNEIMSQRLKKLSEKATEVIAQYSLPITRALFEQDLKRVFMREMLAWGWSADAINSHVEKVVRRAVGLETREGLDFTEKIKKWRTKRDQSVAETRLYSTEPVLSMPAIGPDKMAGRFRRYNREKIAKAHEKAAAELGATGLVSAAFHHTILGKKVHLQYQPERRDKAESIALIEANSLQIPNNGAEITERQQKTFAFVNWLMDFIHEGERKREQ